MTNKERLPHRKESLTMVEPSSATQEPENGIYPALLAQFNPSVYDHNRSLMYSVAQELGKYEPLEGGDFLNGFYPVAWLETDQAAQTINGIAASAPFPKGNAFPTDPKPIDFTRNSRSRNIVIGSSTHAADEILLRSLFESGVDPASVAMVVFDTHFDGMYPTANYPLRSSYQAFLLNAGLGHLTVVGVPEGLSQAYTDGERLDYAVEPENLAKYLDLRKQISLDQPANKREAQLITFLMEQDPSLHHLYLRDLTHHHVVEPHRDQISFIPREVVNRQALFSQLRQMMEQIQGNPAIKHLFVSVDIDVLALYEEMLTATRYSPFSTVLAFGLKPFEGSARMDPDDFTYQVHRHSPYSLYSTPPHGMKSDNLIIALSDLKRLAKNSHLTFGIPYKSHTFLGSIVEAEGNDLNGNTQRLVSELNTVLRK